MSCEMTTKEAIERFEEARKKLNSLMFLSSLQRTVYLEALAKGMQALDERNKFKYCPECGQAIDWSDSND